MKLSEQACEACKSGDAGLIEGEIGELTQALPDWVVVHREGVAQLERVFTFPDFAAALAFTNRVGVLAEAENHHPALLTEWGKVTVTWWTHTVRGLHRNDFILAARTNKLV